MRVPAINWLPNQFGEASSPFSTGERRGADVLPLRALRLAFHRHGLENLPAPESEALALLKDLASAIAVPEIEGFETTGDRFPRIEWTSLESASVIEGGVHVRGAVIHANIMQIEWLAGRLVDDPHPVSPERARAKGLIALGFAAQALHIDLVVTGETRWPGGPATEVTGLNVVQPSEALDLAGLLLRARGNFTIWARESSSRRVARPNLYALMVRVALPSLWRLESAWETANQAGTALPVPSWALLHRAIVALQARDELGALHYAKTEADTASHMGYHFEVLLSQVSGLLDVLAQITNATYALGFNGPAISWGREEFRNRVRGEMPAVPETDWNTLLKLRGRVAWLRDSIHDAPLAANATPRLREYREPHLLVAGPRVKDLPQDLRGHRGGTSGVAALQGTPFLRVDPFIYGTSLLNELFPAVDRIVAHVDHSRVMPAGAVPILSPVAVSDLRSAGMLGGTNHP